MKRSSGPRKTANLSKSVSQQLNAYALVASAAGMGVLALSQPGEAKIVYTKTHRVIGLGQYYDLDLNHDGIADFVLANTYFDPNFVVLASGLRRNVVAGRTYFLRAYALLAGAKIGPALPFLRAGSMAVSDRNGLSDWSGYWVNVSNRYLGLSFKLNGKTHYGWARLNVKWMPYHGFTAALTGYAYETIPNKPIIAGRTFEILPPTPDSLNPDHPAPSASLTNPIPNTQQPASLGMLALGAPGLSIWRREELVSAKQ
jgi:hypothetical protein